MKKIVIVFSLLTWFVLSTISQEAPQSYTFAIKGGLSLGAPGKVAYGDWPEQKPKTSPLIKADLDGILVEKLSMGLTVMYNSLSVENFNKASNYWIIGGTIKPRFTLDNGSQIRPAMVIGYNYIKNDDMKDNSNGLDVGFQLELTFPLQDAKWIVTEFGFFSQPVGGDPDYKLTFAPIFYIAAGIEFGK
jgi:hypothetical protein